MDFVFWQNIISIHQKSFLEALIKQAGVRKVLLVVEHELTPVRKSMGWETPEIKGVEIVMSPSDNQVNEIVSVNKDAVHVMGGIRIGRMITKAFAACAKNGYRIGIMTEPYDNAGFKGLLRKIKYSWYKAKYFRHIHFILAIGKEAVGQYTSLGFDTRRLFPWAYFITLEQPGGQIADSTNKEVNIIYAGRLEEAKGIYKFVTELCNSGMKNFTLDIYGMGSDEDKIRQYVAENGFGDKISVTRYIKHNELLEKYRHYNWVALPSTQKDGWGVIVNEGLLNGLKAICSRKCGVSWAIYEGWNGATFNWEEKNSCRDAILKMLTEDDFADPQAISAVAKKALSGEAGAGYFMKIIASVYDHKERPKMPWEV